MPGISLRKLPYIFFLALLPFAVQWGVLPPAVGAARAQSAFDSMGITRMLDCGVVGSEGYDRCKEAKEEEQRKKNKDERNRCDEAKDDLEKLASGYETAYGRWQDRLKDYRCSIVIEDRQARWSDGDVANAWKEVEDVMHQIDAALKKARQNCREGDLAQSPVEQFEPPACKRAKVELACYTKLKGKLEWELETLDDPEKKCRSSGTSEGYRRCKEIKKKLLPDANLEIEKAKKGIDGLDKCKVRGEYD